MLLCLLGLPFAFVMSWNAICFLDALHLVSWRPNKSFFGSTLWICCQIYVLLKHNVLILWIAFFIQMGNKGAFIRFTAPEMKPDIVTFSAVVSSTLFFCIFIIGNVWVLLHRNDVWVSSKCAGSVIWSPRFSETVQLSFTWPWTYIGLLELQYRHFTRN